MRLGMSIAEARLILHHNPIFEIHNAQAIKVSTLSRSSPLGELQLSLWISIATSQIHSASGLTKAG